MFGNCQAARVTPGDITRTRGTRREARRGEGRGRTGDRQTGDKVRERRGIKTERRDTRGDRRGDTRRRR